VRKRAVAFPKGAAVAPLGGLAERALEGQLACG